MMLSGTDKYRKTENVVFFAYKEVTICCNK